MNSEDHIIYSLRAQGWLGKAGNYTNDRSKARVFTSDEAVEFCKRMTDHNGAATCFPVPVSLLIAVEAK